jgi:hypothetical protein
MTIPMLEGYLILLLAIALATIFVTRWISVPYTLGLVVVGRGILALRGRSRRGGGAGSGMRMVHQSNRQAHR